MLHTSFVEIGPPVPEKILKLFILVVWDRSFCLLLGPPGLN